MLRKIFNIISEFFFILFLIETLFPSKIFSQQKYDFDFNSRWNWEDLINKAVIINPALLKSIEELKKEITIHDARIIFKTLSELDSLKQINGLSSFSLSGSETESSPDSVLKNALLSFNVNENFEGLIESAVRLSKLRENGNMFEFKDRTYLRQPVINNKENIQIELDYSAAEKILEYFNEDSSKLEKIFLTVPYSYVIDEKISGAAYKDSLEHFLIESAKKDKLCSVYKWIYPKSFGNFGGVSIYKNNFKEVIGILKNNDANIISDIEKLTSLYLPDSVRFNIGVKFFFGRLDPAQLSKNKLIAVPLEYFGDDYNYLSRFLIHKIYGTLLKDIQLPIEEFAVESEDRKFVELISKLLTNGITNYVGPIGTETRPWYLLEKDFDLFNETVKKMYSGKNEKEAEAMIYKGITGEAPFYTMATQMAYIIETTLGRNALIESIRRGPVAFFAKYIEAYEEYPVKIREVFTFNNVIESKIENLKLLFPDIIVDEALSLKKYRSDIPLLNKKIAELNSENSDDKESQLMNLLSAQLFLEAGEFEKAEDFFLKGISGKKDEGVLSGKAGDSFLERNAFTEALKFYNLYVKILPSADAYLKRGEFYFKAGDKENAMSDFNKTLSIDPSSIKSKEFLARLK